MSSGSASDSSMVLSTYYTNSKVDFRSIDIISRAIRFGAQQATLRVYHVLLVSIDLPVWLMGFLLRDVAEMVFLDLRGLPLQKKSHIEPR